MKLKDLLKKSLVKEAAPRMKKDPDVAKLMSLLKDVSRIENGIKAKDSSRYSHVKRDFKKFYDALINLKSTLNVKGPTIPESKDDLPMDKMDSAEMKPFREGNINESEGYVEIMDMSMHSETGKNMKNTMLPFVKIWNKWKSGPATERNMHRVAKKDVIDYVTSFLNKNLR